jgi:hypothetical protein
MGFVSPGCPRSAARSVPKSLREGVRSALEQRSWWHKYTDIPAVQPHQRTSVRTRRCGHRTPRTRCECRQAVAKLSTPPYSCTSVALSLAENVGNSQGHSQRAKFREWGVCGQLSFHDSRVRL